MTLRELISSVNPEEYVDSEIFRRLRSVKPEYGSNRHIEVKLVNGNVAVTNVHIGSLGDIVKYPIDIESGLNISKTQLLDAILKEMSVDGFSDAEQSDFWDEMTNLQKAKIIR